MVDLEALKAQLNAPWRIDWTQAVGWAISGDDLPLDEVIEELIDGDVLVSGPPTKVEYRLVVDKGYVVSRYPKRDLEHAEKGVEDAIRDAALQVHGHQDIYIETREITKWERKGQE